MHSTILYSTTTVQGSALFTSPRAPNPEANKAGFCIRRKPHVAAEEGLDGETNLLPNMLVKGVGENIHAIRQGEKMWRKSCGQIGNFNGSPSSDFIHDSTEISCKNPPKTEISCKNPPKPLTFWNSQGLLLGIYMVWKGYAAYDASLQHGQPIHLFTIGSNVVPKHENHDQWIHICQDKWGKWFWTHITWQRTDRHNLEILGISCACWSHTKQDDPEIPSKHVYTVITYYIILYIPIHDMETCL